MGIVNPPVSGGGGSSTLNVVSTAAAYTITAANDVLLVSGAVFNVTLPDATLATSKKLFRIKKTDASLTNIITLATISSQTIDGSTTVTLNTQNETYDLIADGANWQILEHRTAVPLTTYTMTPSATTTAYTKGSTIINDSAVWSRDGKFMTIAYTYQHTAAGTTGSGAYLYPLPTGVTLDSSVKIGGGANGTTLAFGCTMVGNGMLANTSAGNGTWYGPCEVLAQTTTSLTISSTNSANAGASYPLGSGSAVNYAQTNMVLTFTAIIPISGWHE